MGITGQQQCSLISCSCVDHGICSGQLMQSTSLCSGEGDLAGQIDDMTNLGKCDHLIRALLANLTGKPFCEFKLNQSGYNPVCSLR